MLFLAQVSTCISQQCGRSGLPMQVNHPDKSRQWASWPSLHLVLSSFSSPTASHLQQDGIRNCSYSLLPQCFESLHTCLTRPLRGQCWAPAPDGWFIMSYIGTSIQVATDWVVAITPFFIVRNLQMNRRKKISVCAILGLGVLASLAAIMRIAMYPQTDERYYPNDSLGEYTSFSNHLATSKY